MNERKNIDDLFANGLKTYRTVAPVLAWDKLNANLNRKQAKKRLLFLRLAAASVAILLAFTAGYFYADFQKETDLSATNDQSPDIQNSIEQTSIPDTKNTELVNSQLADEQINIIHDLDKQNGVKNSEQKEILIANNSLQQASTKNDNISVSENITSGLVRDENGLSKVQQLEFKMFTNEHNYQIIQIASTEPLNYLDIVEGPEYSFGDYSSNSKSIDNKWTMGAYFAPTYSYREISTNYENQTPADVSANNALNANEEALMSYAGGLNIDLAISKRWGLQSGMYYSRIGQVNNDALVYSVDSKGDILYAIHTSTGNINITIDKIPDRVRIVYNDKDSIVDNTGLASVEQNFDLFEIPFLLKYKMLDRKFSINLIGGLSPAYLVKNHTYLKVEGEKVNVGDSPNLNSLLVNTSIGLGLEYKAFKKLSFSLEPTFKYSLSPLNNNSNFHYYPYYISWFTGIRYKF